MSRLSTHRRLIAALTLLMLFAPVGVMAVSSLSNAVGHQHMHHDNHGATLNGMALEQAGHDRMQCSVVVPCEHGFCASLAIMQTDFDGVTFGGVWHAGMPDTAHPACPKSHSPPPKPLS